MNIFKNSIFKNFSSLSFNYGVQILVQLLFIPIYLIYWNLDTYAEWILISTIPTLLMISNVGLTTYGSNLAVILASQHKKNKTNYVIQNILCFTSLLMIGIICVIFIFDAFLNFQKIFNITTISSSEFFYVLLLISLRYLIISNSSFLSSLYKINHKFHISVYIKTFFTISEVILIWVILIYGGQIFEVIFISFLNYTVSFFIIYILIKKEIKWLKFINLKNINLKFIKKIFYPSSSYLIGVANKGLIAQGTIIILNYFSNDMIIVLYNSLRIITNGVRHIINVMATALSPEITINFAKKKFAKIHKQFKFLIKYNSYVSTFFLILLIFFIKKPFMIWTNYTIEWNFDFFLFFIIANYIDWIALPILLIPVSINKIELFNFYFIINLIIYFLVLIILYPSQQIMAIPLALIACNIHAFSHGFFILNKKILINNILITSAKNK